MTEKKIYFISDAHFGIDVKGQEQREELFCEFLRGIASDAEGLFILGDLFDFWIEYPNAIRPDYFTIVHELRKLSEKNIWIQYMAGNHDFALGPFLKDTIGIVVHDNDFETVLQGKKVYLYHGDGLLRCDWGYRFFKKILRNPFLQRMYKMMHPDWGVALGRFFSGSSRGFLGKRLSPVRVSEYRLHARERLMKGCDIVIFGHTHNAELLHFDGKAYCNTGAWLVHYTYATMVNGEIRLWRYKSGAEPEEIRGQEIKP
jgi:UDP-2,3-diacylglucosamine hydrolase